MEKEQSVQEGIDHTQTNDSYVDLDQVVVTDKRALSDQSGDDKNFSQDDGKQDTGSSITDNLQLYILEKIINTWSKQHESDIAIRKKYAFILLVIVGAQVIFLNVILCLIGYGTLSFDVSIMKLFISGAYAQLFGTIYIVVKYLFSKNSHVILKDISELIGKLSGK